MGKLGAGPPEVDILRHWLGGYIWSSLVGPKLEAGTIVGEAGFN